MNLSPSLSWRGDVGLADSWSERGNVGWVPTWSWERGVGLNVRKCACMSIDPLGGESVEQSLCLGVCLIQLMNSLVTAQPGASVAATATTYGCVCMWGCSHVGVGGRKEFMGMVPSWRCNKRCGCWKVGECGFGSARECWCGCAGERSGYGPSMKMH